MNLQTLTIWMFLTLVVYRYTKPTRGLERLDPFHSMHYEHPGFTAQDVFDDVEEQASYAHQEARRNPLRKWKHRSPKHEMVRG